MEASFGQEHVHLTTLLLLLREWFSAEAAKKAFLLILCVVFLFLLYDPFLFFLNSILLRWRPHLLLLGRRLLVVLMRLMVLVEGIGSTSWLRL